MRKKLRACCLACILAAAIVLPGCSGGNQAPEPVKPEAQTQTPADTRAPSSEDKTMSSGGGEVAAILAKSKAIDEISFEYTITEGDKVEAAGKVWVKGSRVKNELTATADGQAIISIYDTAKAEAYLYFPGEKMATLSELTPEMTGWFQTPANFYDDLEVSSVKIVADETYDGYKCKVMAIVDETGWEEARFWVSEEYGIPLRFETNDAVGTLTIDYKNVKVGSVPDNVFELPQGVRIEDTRSHK